MEPMQKLMQLIPMSKWPKVMQLWSKVAPMTVENLKVESLHEILALVDRPVAMGPISELLAQAAAAEPKQKVAEWFTARLTDGTVERLMASQTSNSTVLHRCVHCGQPEEIDLSIYQ